MVTLDGVRAPSYYIKWRRVGDRTDSGAWRLCMATLASLWKRKKSGASMPNGVTDAERKRAIFLSVIGPRTYKLLSSLVAPSKLGEKTYDELVVALTEHHSPAPSEIVQRFKFNSRFRHAGESVATNVAELRSIAQTCNYGTSLDEMLRDRIVCGINDDRIQQRLLSEKGLTYKKAPVELSQGLETAAKNVRELQSTKLEQPA